MKSIKYLVVLVCMTFASVSSFAQEKELQTESDGFRWYKLSQDGKEGAQSITGTTIIPLSRGYNLLFYAGGKFYMDKWTFIKGERVLSEGVCDKNGREIIAPGRYEWVNNYNDCYEVKINGNKGLCNINGQEIIAPGRYDEMLYMGEHGWIQVQFNGKYGACNLNGREVIAPKFDYAGFEYVYSSDYSIDYDYGLYYKVQLNGKDGAYDWNGKELIAPKYENLTCFDGIFKYKNASGKWVSTNIKIEKINASNYFSNNSSSNSSSSYSSSTTSNSNGESRLLYKGEYTLCLSQSKELNSGYSVGEYTPNETETISIYEDHIKINNVTCNYESTNSNGERVYKGSSLGKVTVYVSPSYEIRYYSESFLNGRGMRVTFPVVKGRSYMSNDNGGGNNAGSYTSPTQPSQPKIEKEQRQPKKAHATYKTCPLCHGSGKCNTCNGTHRSLNGFTGKYIECPNCKPDGKCSYCNGTGKVLGPTEWY